LRTLLWDGGLVVAALLGGHILARMVARALRAKGFDTALRIAGSSPPPGLDDGRGFTPTFVAGMLVRLTVWAAAALWLARQHDRPGRGGVAVQRRRAVRRGGPGHPGVAPVAGAGAPARRGGGVPTAGAQRPRGVVGRGAVPGGGGRADQGGGGPGWRLQFGA